MGKVNSYKDLLVWQKSIALVQRIYSFTKLFPEEERFGLTAQMRRAAVSIPSNIAEGWGRNSTKGYVYHLNIAKGSLYELETQLIIVKEINIGGFDPLLKRMTEEIGKMLASIIRKLETKIIRNQ